MLVVVIPVIVATLAFAWWYRASNTRASRSTDESYEGRLEFVVWSIPALTVILPGGVIWLGSHQLDQNICPSRLWTGCAAEVSNIRRPLMNVSFRGKADIGLICRNVP
jgi:heme/copper-type cytochrome/quinol oxidase subunit 2